MCDGHSVLCECSRLIGTDGGSRSEGLNCLEILDQTVLRGHSLGGQSETDSDGGDKTLRNVSHDDTWKEETLVCEFKTKT